jgi:uncharacterized membrane protein YfcA
LPTDLLFPDVSLWAVGCIFVSYFLGFFVRGAFGFGSNIPIVLLTTSILGPHHAIVQVAVAAFISQIDLLPQGFHTADWRVSKTLIAGMLAGSAIGTWLLVCRVAHRNTGVADYGSCWDGSIPIIGKALEMD